METSAPEPLPQVLLRTQRVQLQGRVCSQRPPPWMPNRANSAAARLRAVRCSDGLGISLRSDHHAVHRQPPIVKYKPNLRTVLLRTDVQMRFQSIAGVANPAERLSQRYRIAKRHHRTAPHQMGHKYLYVSTLHSDVVRGTLRIGRSGRIVRYGVLNSHDDSCARTMYDVPE